MLLLDSGVWVALGEPESSHHAHARGLVLEMATPLAALDLTLHEIANVIGAKKGRTADAARMAQLILTRCRHSLVRVDEVLVGDALRAVAEHGLSAYDAAYVAAARRNGWTLVSIDVRDLVSKGPAATPDAALFP